MINKYSLLIDDLCQQMPKLQLSTDPDTMKIHGCDWTRIYKVNPSAVAFPTSINEITNIIKFANQHKLPLVISGGRTGLSGGAVASNEELVISLDKMKSISTFNAADMTVTCQAGVITEELQQFVQQQGYFFPVNFASRGSSQIGGNIATNAGGINVLRYGLMRDWVASLTVVTGKGDILELNKGLVKNATGYDLRHLFIGSEGTLGIICEATLNVTTPPQDLHVMVCSLPNLQNIIELLQCLQQQLPLTAFEFFSEAALSHVIAKSNLQRPFNEEYPYYVIVEFEVHDQSTLDQVLILFEQALSHGWITDGIISQNPQQTRSLWRLREDISESLASHQPYKNDISVLPSKVPAFLSDLDRIMQQHYPDYEVVWFGHIGDGNLHLNILKPSSISTEQFVTHCEKVNQLVFDTVKKYSGSISAEHGIGLLKKPYLHYTRTQPEIEYLRSIKKIFDPNNILNPGKLIE